MKKLLRIFLIETITLKLASVIAYGIVFENGVQTLIFAGIVLTVSSLFIKPIINLLLLPINLITFNLFKWVSTAVALYIVTLLVPGFRIISFDFAGAVLLFDIPSISLAGPGAFVGFSLIISLITGVTYWIIL